MNAQQTNTLRTRAVANAGYFAIPRHIQRSTQFVSKVTGNSVELTQSDKVVLFYLIDRICFYQQQQGRMFESFDRIADELCVSAKTVSRAVSKLVEHGVVVADLVSRSEGWVYHDVDVDQVFTKAA